MSLTSIDANAPTLGTVAFQASIDHATLVTNYVLDVFASGADPNVAPPLASSDLAKPTPSATGEITVDRAAFFSALAPHSSSEPADVTRFVHGIRRRASIASTTACAPNSLLSSVISSGLRTAAVLTLTFSAPDNKIVRASATDRMPPPTVSGMNTLRAVRATTSAIVSR